MRRWITFLALAIIAASFGALSRSTPVYADLTSVQLAMYDNVGNVGMACVSGTNQNGVGVNNCWATNGQWQTDFYNWWWHNNSTVYVNLYNYSGAFQGGPYALAIAVIHSSTNWECFYDSMTSFWEC